MENAENKITAVSVRWNREAEKMLTAAVQWCDIADIKRQVLHEGALLFRASHGGALLGYYVLRADKLERGFDGVIVAAAGRHPDFDLTASIVPLIEQQFKDCRAIRIHTARAGLIKKLSGMGYQPQEFVMRKSLS